MPFIDDDARELNLKIVYYGPPLAGKTANLQQVHERADPSTRSKLTHLATETERTLFFSFVPPGFAPLRGYAIRLHLYTVPGAVFDDSTWGRALKGVSGVVFVADSQHERLTANRKSLEKLNVSLDVHSLRLSDVPLVFQYNKRDLPNIMSVADLDRAINPEARPRFKAMARLGSGVVDALEACARAVYADAEPRLARAVDR